MNILVLKFPDSADLSKFAAGTKSVKIMAGTDEVPDGTILLSGPLYEEPALPPVSTVHKHKLVGETAVAPVIGETGPSEPV